ncbi:hypothetical protein [Celerinatantimonas sp. YJH-8]|uniref:hypothetical protein n=1 Tax=Celerinatantimonas sp. YJH-8 TaxID=3228714 RepID=UPI0038C21E43
MMNQVDTSEETVNRDWDRIEAEYKLKPEPTPEPAKKAEPAADAQIPDTEQPSMDDAMNSMPLELRKQLTQGVIANGSQAVFEKFGKLKLPQEVFDNLGSSYADLMLKYFPKIKIFAWLDKYKVEIGAATATWGLYMAVKEARKAQTVNTAKPAANDDQTEDKAA